MSDQRDVRCKVLRVFEGTIGAINRKTTLLEGAKCAGRQTARRKAGPVER